jgi:16S rRNA (adenine1518-N6/adenine1519-N6)-dimethyltransferase
VLKNKNELHPVVLSAVREELERSPGRRLKLVANLPYCVATPVLSNLLAADVLPAAMVVTIQMELAERITARPGTKDFGALSVWIQSQCDTRIMRCMPPSVFWPRPKVRSAIVQIVPAAAKRDRIADRKFFHAFIRDLFLHRRKHLRSALWTALKESLSKAEVDAILQQQGQEAEVRAEQLDTAVLLALAESVRQRLTKAR